MVFGNVFRHELPFLSSSHLWRNRITSLLLYECRLHGSTDGRSGLYAFLVRMGIVSGYIRLYLKISVETSLFQAHPHHVNGIARGFNFTYCRPENWIQRLLSGVRELCEVSALGLPSSPSPIHHICALFPSRIYDGKRTKNIILLSHSQYTRGIRLFIAYLLQSRHLVVLLCFLGFLCQQKRRSC